MSEILEESQSGRFYGVYLLCSQSVEKRYKGKCYIGFTVNPNRRINQHNRGKEFGGAKKTSSKGPWQMVMIVHGFPNNIAALQFEWAWQQPMLSTRLKPFADLRRKQPKESYFQFHFRILSRMLNIGPWNRLPLTIRWLESDYECEFEPATVPPNHMQIVSGKITVKRSQVKASQASQQPRAIWAAECHLCMEPFENPERSRIGCLNNLCKLTCHIICLANHIISMDTRNRGHYIPIVGECPLCETQLVWVDLLHKKRKLQGLIQEEEDVDSADELDMDAKIDSDIEDENDVNELDEKEIDLTADSDSDEDSFDALVKGKNIDFLAREDVISKTNKDKDTSRKKVLDNEIKADKQSCDILAELREKYLY